MKLAFQRPVAPDPQGAVLLAKVFGPRKIFAVGIQFLQQKQVPVAFKLVRSGGSVIVAFFASDSYYDSGLFDENGMRLDALPATWSTDPGCPILLRASESVCLMASAPEPVEVSGWLEVDDLPG